MRTFIAVDVDEPNIVAKLREIEQELNMVKARMKLVEPENFHITLRFLGEVPDHVVSDIRSQVLLKIKFKPFTLKLSGIGAFPSPTSARVIWVGVVQGFDELKRIREQLDLLLKDVGVRYEKDEEFTPHITLARLKERPSPEVARFIVEHSSYDIGEMTIKAVRLKKSTLTPRGPIYETIAEARVE